MPEASPGAPTMAAATWGWVSTCEMPVSPSSVWTRNTQVCLGPWE